LCLRGVRAIKEARLNGYESFRPSQPLGLATHNEFN